MTRHLTTEQLSSYLDGEVGSRRAQEIEEHIGSCPACRTQLEAMERLVLGLHRMERRSPPPALAQEVRRQIAVAAATPQSVVQRLRFLLTDFALRPALRTSAAMGLAIVFSVFLLTQGLGRGHHDAPALDEPTIFTVQTYFGTPPLDLPPTTSEVAGREFILSGDRWIQRGLEGKKPEAHVAVKSPEGRAMLSKYSDLEFLLADGTPVVLRYRLATVELSGS